MKYDTFIANIRKLMKQNELSLIKFAEKIGFTQPSVSKWLCGKIKPSVDAVMAICNEFDVSADWLLFGKEV